MQIKTSHRAYTGYVETYIGSAYDTVKLVADHMDTVSAVAGWLAGNDYVPNVKVDLFKSPNDFVDGATQVLTLSYSATTAEDMDIYFDGVRQNTDQYILTLPSTVTFQEPIPSRTSSVEIKYRHLEDPEKV